MEQFVKIQKTFKKKCSLKEKNSTVYSSFKKKVVVHLEIITAKKTNKSISQLYTMYVSNCVELILESVVEEVGLSALNNSFQTYLQIYGGLFMIDMMIGTLKTLVSFA